MSMSEWFQKFSSKVSERSGHYSVFLVACLLIIVWAFTGPMFAFSANWQLVVNTGTTIITFLMVFLVQNTQNRDARAIHLKLDELIAVNKEARNEIIDIEHAPEQQFTKLTNEMQSMREKIDAAQHKPDNGKD